MRGALADPGEEARDVVPHGTIRLRAAGGLGSKGPEGRSCPGPVYARPHDIDVDRHPNGGGIEAVVRGVRPLGDVVRIELERRDGTGSVDVKLSCERYGESPLAKGERVYLRPCNPQVFLEARGPIAVAQ
jgi:hypothetical protein